MTQAEEAIAATVRMFSGCEDVQTSADVSNVGSFKLPDPAGRAGGALTSSLLNVTYADHHNTGSDMTFKETLMAVRDQLQEKGYEQIPQLSSSRPTDVHSTFTIVPDDFSGKRRAVMIGINYIGDDPGELSGCHNDVHNMKNYIMDCHGFEEDDITLLLDDGENINPTAANIIAAFRQLASDAEPGDAIFVHYSGHGCSINDDEQEESDGKDEALCPVDYAEAGVLRDDDVFAMLVAPLPQGCTMTCVMDCCHSGTIVSS
jgi:metacaspase-1